MGCWGATVAASPTIGVVVGGPLVDWFGWQLLFVIQRLIAVVAVGLAWQVLPTTGERRPVRFDIVGAVTLGIGVGAILTGLGAQLEMVVVLIVAMTITGLGMSFGRSVVMTAVSRTVVDRDLGVASVTDQMVVTLGSAIGISTLTTIIGDSDASARFFGVFALAAAVAVVAAVGTHVAMRGTVDAPTPVDAAAR